MPQDEEVGRVDKKKKQWSKAEIARFDHLEWKRVPISELNRDDRKPAGWTSTDSNHYDDSDDQRSRKLCKTAARDLEAQPHEPVGFFYGLEVLEPGSYAALTDMIEKGKHSSSRRKTGDDESPTCKNDREDNESNHDKNKTPPEEQKNAGDDLPEGNATKSAKKKKRKNKNKKSTSPTLDDAAPASLEQGSAVQTADDAESKALSKGESPDVATSGNKKRKRSTKTVVGKEEPDAPSKTVAKTDDGTTEPLKSGSEEPVDVDSVALSWSSATGGVVWDDAIVRALAHCNYLHPTPIQAATAAPAVYGRCNLVGAAPTGSGKTLAFGLPILQWIVDHVSQQGNSASLYALILTPTRELALQISHHLQKVVQHSKSSAEGFLCNRKPNYWTATLVGGLAKAKQMRLLNARPPIVVATPGRLWEMISNSEHKHLNDLSQLRFLVIDEADRMIHQKPPGHSQNGDDSDQNKKSPIFPELEDILHAVHQANPMNDDDDSDDGDEADLEDDMDENDRLMALPGIRGEAKVDMLSEEILQAVARERDSGVMNKEEPAGSSLEMEGDSIGESEVDANSMEDDESQISLPLPPPVHRQTFIFSATLTLPSITKKSLQKKKRQRKVDIPIPEVLEYMLDKIHAKGKTKVVDLSGTGMDKRVTETTGNQRKTQSTKVTQTTQKRNFSLPPGLKLQEVFCTVRHKDSHLYAYLMTTTEGRAGPCLVFCNSIAAVRRVGATLRALGMQVRLLHAQMQQRARLKAVEMLRDSKKPTVVVATDVAARGLDIPSVASVVHYDTSRSIDGFVHRSGRTARGVGNTAVGASVSLVAPGEDKMQSKIAATLGTSFEKVHFDGRLLNEAQKRANLASKVAEIDDLQSKCAMNNKWFKDAARDAGLELDDDILEEGLVGGDARDKARLREAEKARSLLKVLLKQPFKTHRYGKFLSTNNALNQQEFY